MTNQPTDLLERLQHWAAIVHSPLACSAMREASDALETQAATIEALQAEVARLGSLNCPHCGETALSDEQIAALSPSVIGDAK